MTGEKQTQGHVAILVFPFGTHGAPLLHLTLKLAQAAPNITFSFFNTAGSNDPIFGPQHDVISNIRRYDVDDGVPKGHVWSGKRQEDIELFLSVTPENFTKAMEDAVRDTGKKISCLLTDSFIWQAADMAEELKVPWVQFWTAGACSLSAHIYTDLIRDTAAAEPSVIKDLPLDFVPGMPSALSVKDVPMEVLGGNLNSVFSRLLHKMGQTMSRGTTIALNSFEELDPSIMDDFKSKFDHVLSLGPFTQFSHSLSNMDPYSCIIWLNSKKPASVAYVSFGTVTTLPPHELMALAEALEESKVTFIWSLKDNLKEQLPKGFIDRTSERGMVVPWAPQSQVLEHAGVGVFITHCGWNSVLESITGGVSMICRPFFGDQRMNGRFVSDVWRIGVGAKNGVISKDGLMEALDIMLSNEQGKKMRERARALKELAMQALGPEGSSTRNLNTLKSMITGTNFSKAC